MKVSSCKLGGVTDTFFFSTIYVLTFKSYCYFFCQIFFLYWEFESSLYERKMVWWRTNGHLRIFSPLFIRNFWVRRPFRFVFWLRENAFTLPSLKLLPDSLNNVSSCFGVYSEFLISYKEMEIQFVSARSCSILSTINYLLNIALFKIRFANKVFWFESHFICLLRENSNYC